MWAPLNLRRSNAEHYGQRSSPTVFVLWGSLFDEEAVAQGACGAGCAGARVVSPSRGDG